ncbi:MAG: glutamate--tRNA ligase [Acidobacteriota bacterium]|nr:glutamate--tRNA ligase [Acidobacteriota bacterium]
MTTETSTPIRVRFAPSPTGFLHVGGARTAIYNDLLRQRLGGAFILRIEDTDRQRSDEAMTRQIQDALAWIGVTWDEGPFLQSERLERHRERARELLDGGLAYRAYETPDELEALRAAARAEGGEFRYRAGRSPLAAAEIARRAGDGDPFVVRFRMPDEPIRFHDLVRGDVEFPPEALDDLILLRSDGSPTYHMSVVADDIDMAVTHVIRGEDHLSNTPKHVAMFAAFGAPAPTFAHLPLILGTDRKRLSKRTGATSVEEFRGQGILPQALYNFLALLGWSPGDDRELMSRAEMAAVFSTDRLNDSAAVFDPDKLGWMNAQYMASLPLAALRPHLEPFLEAAGLAAAAGPRLDAALDLHRTRARTLADLAAAVKPYFAETIDYDPALTAGFAAQEELPGDLRELAARWRSLAAFDVAPLEDALRALCAERGAKAGHLIHPVRMALSGAKAGPPLFDLVAVMGPEATARHLESFLAHLAASPPPASGAGG